MEGSDTPGAVSGGSGASGRREVGMMRTSLDSGSGTGGGWLRRVGRGPRRDDPHARIARERAKSVAGGLTGEPYNIPATGVYSAAEKG